MQTVDSRVSSLRESQECYLYWLVLVKRPSLDCLPAVYEKAVCTRGARGKGFDPKFFSTSGVYQCLCKILMLTANYNFLNFN